MPKKSKKLPAEWVTTTAACESLSLTPDHLRKTLRLELMVGTHYLEIGARGACRPTYRWNVSAIRAYLSRRR